MTSVHKMNKSPVHKTQDLKTLNPNNLNNCLEKVRFQATAATISRRICDQKARNMWPKSTEYVAKKHRICGQKAQNMWPKNAELSFKDL